jgi:aquaporin Z
MFNKYAIEFLGTLLIVYIVLLTKGNPLAIGAAVAIAIYLGGKISGGNFNPAISVALVRNGTLPKADLIIYILAQIVAGLAAIELYNRVQL